jgi:hypothetical protein
MTERELHTLAGLEITYPRVRPVVSRATQDAVLDARLMLIAPILRSAQRDSTPDVDPAVQQNCDRTTDLAAAVADGS